MLVSFTGAHSTGKTTLLNECGEEDYQFHEPFEFVSSITRKVSERYDIKIGTNMSQLLVISSHIENSLLKHAFLDRCILDGLIYTMYFWERSKVATWIQEYAKHVYTMLLPRYDVIFYTDPDGVPLVNDGVRPIDMKFRNSIIAAYEKMFKQDEQLAKKVVRLTGNVEQRMLKIRETLYGKSR